MSKARTDWAFGERPVASSKLDQANTDYITPGIPIWSFGNDAFSGGTCGANYGWWPYNPQKSVYNRLYLLAQAVNDNVDKIAGVDISFNGGASWTDAFPSLVNGPVDFGNPALTYVETWDLDAQVASFQWLGIRQADNVFFASYHFRLLGFLYRSTDTPF